MTCNAQFLTSEGTMCMCRGEETRAVWIVRHAYTSSPAERRSVFLNIESYYHARVVMTVSMVAVSLVNSIALTIEYCQHIPFRRVVVLRMICQVI